MTTDPFVNDCIASYIYLLRRMVTFSLSGGIGFIVAYATDANPLYPVNRSRSDPRIRGIIVVRIAVVVQVGRPLSRCTECNQ